MAETATVSAAQMLSTMIKASQGQTEKYIKNCPEGKRLTQFAPGKATPLWLVGHLAAVADFLGNTIGLNIPGSLPPDYRKLFMPVEFGGKPITTNAADYPSWDEVAKNYGKVMSNLAEGLKSVPDADLPGPVRGKLPDPLKSLFETIQGAAQLNILHDSHHRGQLAQLANRPD